MAIHPRDLDRSKKSAVHRLAFLGSAQPDELDRFTPRPLDERRWELAGQPLYRHSFGRTIFRYCPTCVLTDLDTVDGPTSARPWLRMEWTISHFRSCQSHGTLLLAADPERRPFAPYDFAATIDRLRASLPKEARAATVVPASLFQKWLRERIVNADRPQTWLDEFDLNVAIAFCEALGISALHPPKVRIGQLDARAWSLAADEGFRIASAGEDSIRQLLDRLNSEQRSTRGVWGPRDTVGHVYGVLDRTKNDPAWQGPRRVVADFVIGTLPLPAGTVVLGTRITTRRVHTIHTAAKASGIHNRTARSIFERKALAADGIGSGLGDHRVAVEASRVEATLASLKGALTTPGVVRATGIPLPWLRTIIDSGYLPSLLESVGRVGAKHRFARVDVEGMLDVMFAGCVDMAASDDQRVGLMLARARAVASQAAVLRLLFEGRLRWKGRLSGARGFKSLLVDSAEVTKLVRSEPGPDGLSRLAVLEHIRGLARDSVDPLVDLGHLDEMQEFSPDARRMVRVVTRESADRFIAANVSLGELVQRSGLHHKRVRRILRLAGISESLDRDLVGCFFYPRDRVDAAERDDADFWDFGER